MTIHIFNPDHDLALAAGISNFTAPHAGRQLRADLGYLPALWADDGDAILVDDVDAAVNGYRKLKLNHRPQVQFVAYQQLKALCHASAVEFDVWGWNISLRDRLLRAGVPLSLLPADDQLDAIRRLSNRGLAVELLSALQHHDGVTGRSCVCHTYDDVMHFLQQHRDIVLKAPWSSSGRGVRYITSATLDDNAVKWSHNTLQKQHTIIAETRCRKVHDFAMEFLAAADGTVTACGLSLFSTERGAYTGNRLENESDKEAWLSQYIAPELFRSVVTEIEHFLSQRIQGRYVGPLGVDMMVVAGDNATAPFLLNPCIEINLRRTMGHVALALSNRAHSGAMHIEFNGKAYKLTLSQ